MNFYLQNLAVRIKALRRQRRITQEKLAEQIDLCSAPDCTPNDLLWDSPQPDPCVPDICSNQNR